MFSLFFPQRRTFRLKNTVSYNTRLLVLFLEMKLFFFCRFEKNLNTDAVLFSLQFFSHSPRCCEKILSYPKDYLIPLLFTLSVFLFFHSPTMSCLSRGETNEMTTRIFAEKKKASGFLKTTTTTSKPPRQVSIYCPLKHIF